MFDAYLIRRLGYMAIFVFVSALVLFVKVLPLHDPGAGFPPPDLILCFAFAWVVRRPDYLPVLLVAAVLLVSDMVTLSPPGLAPFLAIIGLEALSSRREQLAGQGFALEVGLVAGILMLMFLAERIILGLFMVPQPGFGLGLLAVLITIAFYPLVVAITAWGFRIEWLKPGALDPEARV